MASEVASTWWRPDSAWWVTRRAISGITSFLETVHCTTCSSRHEAGHETERERNTEPQLTIGIADLLAASHVVRPSVVDISAGSVIHKVGHKRMPCRETAELISNTRLPCSVVTSKTHSRYCVLS